MPAVYYRFWPWAKIGKCLSKIVVAALRNYRKRLKAEIGNCVMGVSCAVLRSCVFVYYGIAENSLEPKSAKLPKMALG